MLVGDKLYETNERISRPHSIIDQLETEVEFPDIRWLVNNEKIGLEEVLKLRDNTKSFRNWLQDESERDRNAVIAYHHEVAKESGWIGGLGASGTGAAVGGATGGPAGAIAGAFIGTTVGESMKYLLDLAFRLNEAWRPVVFGNWARERINKILEQK